MGFEEFLDHALASVENGARGHFSRSRVGVPIREGSEEDYWDDQSVQGWLRAERAGYLARLARACSRFQGSYML